MGIEIGCVPTGEYAAEIAREEGIGELTLGRDKQQAPRIGDYDFGKGKIYWDDMEPDSPRITLSQTMLFLAEVGRGVGRLLAKPFSPLRRLGNYHPLTDQEELQ